MVVSLNQVNSNFFITYAVTRSISVRYDIVCRTVNYTNRSCVLSRCFINRQIFSGL